MIILGDSCPVCKSKNIEINLFEYQLPDSIKILIYSFVCKDCLFKTNEIFPLEYKEPVKFQIRINNPEDLRKKIVKSPYTKFYIEEIDIEILPGSIGYFYIYTLEEFLNHILNLLSSLKEEKLNEKIEYLKKVLDGKEKLTIHVEDEKGLAKII